jgi:hypothetical protein
MYDNTHSTSSGTTRGTFGWLVRLVLRRLLPVCVHRNNTIHLLFAVVGVAHPCARGRQKHIPVCVHSLDRARVWASGTTPRHAMRAAVNLP